MRVLKGIRWTSVLLVTVSCLTNADLILDNQTVITDIRGITINPTTGDIRISTVSEDYVVTRGGSTPPPTTDSVAITAFNSSSYQVDVGGQVTVSWSTEFADGCTASGGSGGWSGSAIALPSGSKQLTLTQAGDFNFTLTCTGPNGPASDNFWIEVLDDEPTPTTTDCGSVPLSGNVSSWKSFWRYDFPGPSNSILNTYIPRRGYQAFEFNTGDVVDNGALASVQNVYTGPRPRLGAISECPGDFNVASECTYTWGFTGGISWATNGTPGACQLKPNTTYYANFTFTNGTDPNSTSCEVGISCVATLKHINARER